MWLDGRALQEAVGPLEPVAEIDLECSINMLVLCVTVLEMGWWFWW